MTSNFDVVRAWRNGFPTQSGHMQTDGFKLWSYSLLIGYCKDGEHVVVNYMGKNMYSMTTSHHVSLAKSVADRVVEP